MLGTGLEAQSHFFDRSSAIEAHARLALCATHEQTHLFHPETECLLMCAGSFKYLRLGCAILKTLLQLFFTILWWKISAVLKLQQCFYDRETFMAHITNCNMKAQGVSVCLVYSLQSSEPRSSQDQCTQLDPSPSPEPGNKGSATCCVLIWCAPQRTPSCCQTCPFPTLQETLVLFNAAASKHTVV